jgi:hypothetical protein
MLSRMSLSRFFPWSSSHVPARVQRATQQLAEALVNMNAEGIRTALAAGADANGSLQPPRASCTRTFLQHVIINEAEELALLLLERGAQPMAISDNCCWPAPHLATLCEARRVIDQLRQRSDANFDAQVLDPMTGEHSTARQIAARRGKAFADWFGQRFSLTDAARPPEFEDEGKAGLAKWREQSAQRRRTGP